MMDQFFHLRHHARFRRRHVFPIGDVDRAARQFVDHLAQDAHALPHFFDPHQIAIVAIARAADHDIEIVLLVIEIGMFAPQIVLDAAAAQIRAGKRVGDRAIFRDHADVFRAIDEDAIAREQFVDLIELRNEIIEKLFELRDESFRQDRGSVRRRACKKW